MGAKWSGKSPKRLQKWSGRTPKKLRNGLEKLKGLRNGLGGQSPENLRNGLAKAEKNGKPKTAQKWSGRSPKKPRDGRGRGAGVAPAIVLGFQSLPLTLKGSTALTASVGLALLWSVQQPQLYLGRTFSALSFGLSSVGSEPSAGL